MELDKLYNSSTSQKKAIYFSKLALLELCGWIEESVDDIIIRHANRNLKVESNREYCSKKIVKPTYGFQYTRNIRPMLISLIGLVEVENLERKLERTGSISQLAGCLANIKVSRNIAAHTHLKGVTMRFNAPSRTIGDFNQISALLEQIDNELRNS